MGSLQHIGSDAIRTPGDVMGYYQRACRPAHRRRLGFEWERHVVDAQGHPLDYRGQNGRPGTYDLITGLIRFGWTLVYEDGNLNPISLKRVIPGGDPNNPVDLEQLTFEPMGAAEYSSPACFTVGELAGHLDRANRELLEVCEAIGASLLGAGYHPCSGFTPRITMPKQRYAIMSRCVSPESLDAAVNTCSAQFSFDYTSEADFVGLGQRLFQLAPVVMGFKNSSPFHQGVLMGPESVRMNGWNLYADERGVRLGSMFAEGFGFAQHAEEMFQTPVMLLVQDGHYAPAPGGLRFVDLATAGQATLTHYATQLSTQSPVVRLRSNLELGVADSGPDPALVVGTAAFLKGLLYDNTARHELGEVVGAWDEATCDHLRRQVPLSGLATPLGNGRTLHAVATDLMRIAADSLTRIGERPDLLAPLQDVLDHGSLAVRAQALFRGRGGAGQPVGNRDLVAFYATPTPAQGGATFHPTGTRARAAGQSAGLGV